ncbi:glycosyltransferase family 87 protein [Xanthovirga aplysinae]|uniref:glycosyltransferase family 87 protein n=1 Tax=Xanthovirga aplysinae TaxID=2529853 RepID=UPI0012BBC40A|nr:glycosyltransferase family 87 protein [Xanthovirga aplysinae]MTI33138.1 DUF2029 domain-containing protein [Xanthovirga aplysinae]
MKSKIRSLIADYRIITWIYLLFALGASVQCILLGSKTIQYEEFTYEHYNYNNYIIFKSSFQHLKEGKNLYKRYPQEHQDFFKYTPTFAVFFGIFSILPNWAGLSLWTFINCFILLLAIYSLPQLNQYQKGLILIICLIEAMTSMQNQQSNLLIAGLLILSFSLLERKKYLIATLCIVSSTFIKLFGIFGIVLFLFYPQKWKLAFYSIFWTLLVFSIPLFYINLEQYRFLIHSYGNLLSDDYAISYGFSVMGWLHSWLGIELDKNFIILIGAGTFLVPLIQVKKYNHYTFRLLTLSSLLIWLVIFNHRAESATYIIAMTGVSIWLILSRKSKINILLFVNAFILTSLSPTDIFPASLRDEFVRPYVLKAFPCILIWFKIIFDMVFEERRQRKVKPLPQIKVKKQSLLTLYVGISLHLYILAENTFKSLQ